MMTIHLNQLKFFSYHGVLDEEKIIGGQFEVNISVDYIPASTTIKHLHDTINYVSIYEMVKVRMQQPAELLETIATELAQQILAHFSIAQEVKISITKLHPPIAAFQGSVGVSFTLKRDH